MPQEDFTTVTDYRRTLSGLLGDLKKAQEYAQELGLDETAEHAAQTHSRIENSFFSVAVVGEFKRGKSTLINALLGNRILPDSILPCSATLNRVTYGPTPSARIYYRAKDGVEARSEDIRVEELVDFVTKLTPDSETRAADIKEALVFYPTPYCRDKADIIDTPGLNDDETMTAVTLEVIPQVDAAIMLVMAEAPFAGTEGDFLNKRMLMSDIGRVLFVVNRIDSIDPDDRARLLQHIEGRIRKSVEHRAAELFGDNAEEREMFAKRIGSPRVFGVSAKQALKAKMSGNDALLQQSGFVEFEKALEHFLTYDKGNVTIQVLADCVVSTSSKILQQVVLRERAGQMQEQDFEAVYQSAMATLQELRQRYDKEMKEIDQAGERTFNYACSTLDLLEGEIRKAVDNTVLTFQITPLEIDKARVEQTRERLGKKISEAIHDVVTLLSEKTQVEIERELRSEINRLQGFADEVKKAMGQIEFEFRNIEVKEVGVRNEVGDIAISSAASALPYASGMIAGYQEAGLKGAVVGGVFGAGSGIVAAMSGVILAAVIGLPLAWPVTIPCIIIGGIVSSFTGKWAARKAFAVERVEKFKETYKQAILSVIETEMGTKKFEFARHIKQQVGITFESLKKHVHLELGTQIENTQKTLDDLRRQRARSQAEREVELKHLADMHRDTEKIQTKALAKSNELREITSV